MSKQYHIDVSPSIDSEEAFEKDGKNIMEVRVQFPTGEIVSDSKYKVEITLSPDAMVGLGTELIRKGLRLKEGETTATQEFEQLSGICSSLVSQNMGVLLTPHSCELLIASDDFGKVSEVVEKLSN